MLQKNRISVVIFQEMMCSSERKEAFLSIYWVGVAPPLLWFGMCVHTYTTGLKLSGNLPNHNHNQGDIVEIAKLAQLCAVKYSHLTCNITHVYQKLLNHDC